MNIGRLCWYVSRMIQASKKMDNENMVYKRRILKVKWTDKIKQKEISKKRVADKVHI